MAVAQRYMLPTQANPFHKMGTIAHHNYQAILAGNADSSFFRPINCNQRIVSQSLLGGREGKRDLTLNISIGLFEGLF
jgi:hypothetical protein